MPLPMKVWPLMFANNKYLDQILCHLVNVRNSYEGISLHFGLDVLMKLCSVRARHLCHGNNVLLVPPMTKHLPTPLREEGMQLP